MKKPFQISIIVFTLVAQHGCVTKNYHVAVDPITVESNLQIDAKDIEKPKKTIGDQILEEFFGPGSVGGTILAASASYQIRYGRWPKTKEELIEGIPLAGISPDFPMQEVDLEFQPAENETMKISFSTPSGVSGDITLDENIQNRPNQSAHTTPASAPR